MSSKVTQPGLKKSSVALAGLGTLGLFIFESFYRAQYNIRVLTRKGSTNPRLPGLRERGASIHEVDYQDVHGLTEALQAVHVVICLFKGNATEVQPNVATAAKQAGVLHFIPAEFAGTDTTTNHPGVQRAVAFRKFLDDLELCWTVIATGVHASYIYRNHPTRVLDFKNKRATLVGSGETAFSMSSEPDIAEFTRHVIELPQEAVCCKVLRCESLFASWMDIIRAAGGPDGWAIEHRHLNKREGEPMYGLNGIDFVLSRIEAGEVVLFGNDNELVLGPNKLMMGHEDLFKFYESWQ